MNQPEQCELPQPQTLLSRARAAAPRFLPLLAWLPQVSRRSLKCDLWAGMTGAVGMVSIIACARPSASRSMGVMSCASGRFFQNRSGISRRIMPGFGRAGLKVLA